MLFFLHITNSTKQFLQTAEENLNSYLIYLVKSLLAARHTGISSDQTGCPTVVLLTNCCDASTNGLRQPVFAEIHTAVCFPDKITIYKIQKIVMRQSTENLL